MTDKHFCWLYFLWLPLGINVVGTVSIGVFHTLELPVDEAAIDAYGHCLEFALIFIIALRNYSHVMIDDYRRVEKSKLAFLKKVLLFFTVAFLAGEISEWAVSSFFPNAVWFNESLLKQYQETVFTPLFLVDICVFAPITEEILFRYILQSKIKSKPWNIIIISLIFGFLHAGFSVAILVYTVLGLCLGIAFEKTQDINVSICVHILNNVIWAIDSSL